MFILKYKMKHMHRIALLVPIMIQQLTGNPLIVAHRGASRDAPENTLPAFELAWEQGADAIEGDFHLTQDGHIVCIHDRDTEKYTGKKWIVAESTLGQLKTLDVGLYHSEQYKGTRIPTISEVFATIPSGKKIYIEIKCGKEIVPTLLREIKTAGLQEEQIVVIAFDHEVVKEVKSQAPQLKACWLSAFKEDDKGLVSPSLASALSTLSEIDADGFSSSRDGITEPFITGIRDAGYEYHVWTVDEPETGRKFKVWGALSITTNVPGLMRGYLAR